MLRTLLTTFLCLVLALAVCASSDAGNRSAFAHPPSGAQDVPSDTVITLIRTECYGTCPAYSLTISADGKVVYKGHEHVKQKGEVESRISQEKVKELIAAFEKIDYFNLMDKYFRGKESCPRWYTDMPYAVTSLTLNGKKKSVNHYYGCTGSKVVGQLMALEYKIDAAVNVKQWIE